MVGDSLLAGCFGVVVDEVISARHRRAWDQRWPSWKQSDTNWAGLERGGSERTPIVGFKDLVGSSTYPQLGDGASVSRVPNQFWLFWFEKM